MPISSYYLRYNSLFQSRCRQLKEKLAELASMKSSPARFIVDYTEREINKIDVRREEEIEALDKYYGEMIERIRALQKECIEAICTTVNEIKVYDTSTLIVKVEADEKY